MNKMLKQKIGNYVLFCQLILFTFIFFYYYKQMQYLKQEKLVILNALENVYGGGK